MTKIIVYAKWLAKAFIAIFFRFRLGSLGENVHIGKRLRLDGVKNLHIGSGVYIMPDCWLSALSVTGRTGRLEIGSGSYIGRYAHIVALGTLRIGCKVLIADKVYISDNIHGFENPEVAVMDQPLEIKGSVSIGDGSWIGENVCVIGASIGMHCVIGANSVVLKDIPDFCVAVGAPARIIKKYDKSEKSWVHM